MPMIASCLLVLIAIICNNYDGYFSFDYSPIIRDRNTPTFLGRAPQGREKIRRKIN